MLMLLILMCQFEKVTLRTVNNSQIKEGLLIAEAILSVFRRVILINFRVWKEVLYI